MALTVSSLNHRFCSVQMITEPCFVLHNPSPQKWDPLYYSCHNIPTDKINAAIAHFPCYNAYENTYGMPI